MPTPNAAFGAVAAALAQVDPGDDLAVETFFRQQFLRYPEPARALIADFLQGQTGMPSAEALAALRKALAGPANRLPGIEAPAWDKAFGPAMEYTVLAGAGVAWPPNTHKNAHDAA